MAKRDLKKDFEEWQKPRIGGKDVRPEACPELPPGVKLAAVQYMDPADLTENSANKVLFKAESAKYFDTLRADIQERGIIVPLLAKPDGVLLAGHNRLKVALELGLKMIPVQFVQGKITPEAETGFLIKDNLLRRQLTPDERIGLYRKLYPDFDEKVKAENRGGNTANKGQTQVKKANPPIEGLTAEAIAKDTGLNKKAVERDLAKVRKDVKQSKLAKPAPAGKTLADLKAKLAKKQARRDELKAALQAIEKEIKGLERALAGK